jgi:membrane-bound serine protease (ClpP class)
MTWIILLFALGIGLIALEVIVPGGIMGSIGAVMMFIACVLSFIEFGTGGGMLAVATAVFLTGITLYIEFRILPKTTLGRRAFLNAEISATTSNLESVTRNLIGKSAKAVTMLSPSGYVTIDGQRYEAFSESGQVPAGASLEVIGADNFRLIVTLTHTN